MSTAHARHYTSASSSRSTKSKRRKPDVTEARSRAQRARLDAQAHSRQPEEKARKPKSQQSQQQLQARRRALTPLSCAIDDYLQDHIGGNHSKKTVEWHTVALGLLRSFLQEERGITLVGEVDAPDLSAWFAHLRQTPGQYGKLRSERTVQTYARSARAFFHWLVRQGTIEQNPFERVVFPKVGKPRIQIIEPEEFERLLLACAPPNESGPLAERAMVRNRAILWLLYDTGIRVSELINLRVGDLDRKKGIITVLGKGNKERRVALGSNCLRHLLYYLDRQRPDEEELADWGSAGEDHLFLSETRTPLTRNGVELLFKRLRERAGITDKRISPHILPTGCATRLKGENVAPSSPGLASTHRIERRPLSTAQGRKDGTSSIIQRMKRHNARIHVAADRNTNMLKLYRQPFFRCGISSQKQL